MNSKFKVLVDGELTDNDLKEIGKIFSESSFNWEIERGEFRNKNLEIAVTPGAVLSFFLILPLGKYLQTLASEAAKDHYQSLKEFFSNLRKRCATVFIRDVNSSIIYRLPSDLSDEEFVEAMKSLIEIDINKFHHGWVVYNKDKNTWNTLDEEMDF